MAEISSRKLLIVVQIAIGIATTAVLVGAVSYGLPFWAYFKDRDMKVFGVSETPYYIGVYWSCRNDFRELGSWCYSNLKVSDHGGRLTAAQVLGVLQIAFLLVGDILLISYLCKSVRLIPVLITAGVLIFVSVFLGSAAIGSFFTSKKIGEIREYTSYEVGAGAIIAIFSVLISVFALVVLLFPICENPSAASRWFQSAFQAKNPSPPSSPAKETPEISTIYQAGPVPITETPVIPETYSRVSEGKINAQNLHSRSSYPLEQQSIRDNDEDYSRPRSYHPTSTYDSLLEQGPSSRVQDYGNIHAYSVRSHAMKRVAAV